MLKRAWHEQPVLALLDVDLPDLDGYAVASRLRELPETARAPIVFITGPDAPVHRMPMFGLGPIFLKRPITPAHLLRAVGRALHAPES